MVDGDRQERESQKDLIIENSFRGFHIGLIFSHLSIRRKNFLEIHVFFVDSKLESRRLRMATSRDSSGLFLRNAMKYHPTVYYDTFTKILTDIRKGESEGELETLHN